MNWSGYPQRVRAGAALLALIAVVSCIKALRVDRWADARNEQKYEDRAQALRLDLPSHGPVGYIGDDVPSNADQNLHFHPFFHMQYAVAPVLLVDSPQYPLVIGDFRQPVDYERLANLHLALVKDYGNGVMLLRSANP
jgi:hypothetical protein